MKNWIGVNTVTAKLLASSSPWRMSAVELEALGVGRVHEQVSFNRQEGTSCWISQLAFPHYTQPSEATMAPLPPVKCFNSGA